MRKNRQQKAESGKRKANSRRSFYCLLPTAYCLLGFALLWFLTGEAQACPMCSEALSAQEDALSATKLTQGYARSIALLMGAPYLLFAGVATWIVRSTRRNHRNTE